MFSPSVKRLLYPFKILDQILFLLIAEVEIELRIVVLNHDRSRFSDASISPPRARCDTYGSANGQLEMSRLRSHPAHVDYFPAP